MLRKTSASIGLFVAATAGAPLTISPAYAHANLIRGWHSHSNASHHSRHHNRNWNGSRHRARIYIRVYVYNKNNNHAIALARPERRETSDRREARPAPVATTAVPRIGVPERDAEDAD